MNEFTAKKIGEVLAFAEVGVETFEKGKNALIEVFGAERVDEIINKTKQHGKTLNYSLQGSSMLEIVDKKVIGTGEKLRHMRDYYVGDEWDNSTELLEWSGFFEGAAIVHWALVETSVLESGLNDLSDFAREIGDFHKKILEECSEKLKELGKKRGRE